MRSTPWIRFATVLAARGVLASVFGLLFWAVAPMLLGWHSTTVMTGSMEPSLHVGDVVVSKPVEPHQLRKGQVLLFHDPDHAGVLRLHRFDTLNTDGTLTTKGDANPAADSTPITDAAVVGVGYLRVPLVGTPVVWMSNHHTGPLAILGAALLATAAVAIAPAAAGNASPSRVPRRRGRHRAPQRPSGRTAVMVIAMTCTIGTLALPVPAAAAGFAATAATSTSTLTAATATPVTAMTCASNANGSVTVGWTYSGTDPDRFTVLVDGQAVTTQPGSSRAATLSSWNLFTWRTSTVRIRTDLTSTWTTTSDSTVHITTIRFLGIGRTSCDA